jgi:FixJ family two-component response regulator
MVPASISETTPIVFIVDDDEAVRDSLSIALEAAGYAVLAFGSARHFLDAYVPGRPGCLLVDLDLPGMDGRQLVGALVGRDVPLPAVLMSARLGDGRFERPLPRGVVAILQKPFGERELIARVRFALGGPPLPDGDSS